MLTFTKVDASQNDCFPSINLGLNGTYDASHYTSDAKNVFDDVDTSGSTGWSSRTYTGWVSVVFDEMALVDSLDYKLFKDNAPASS